MVGEIIFSVACFLTGMVIPKILGLHKCKYETVVHKLARELDIPGFYGSDSAMLTCKQCTICNDRIVRISNGRETFKFDKEFVLDQIDAYEKIKKEKEEKALLATLEERLKTPEQRERERLEAEVKAKQIADELAAKQVELNTKKEEKERKDRQMRDAMMNSPGDGDIVYFAHRTNNNEGAKRKKNVGKYKT